MKKHTKKQFIALAMVMAFSVFTLGGCAAANVTATTDVKTETTTVDTASATADAEKSLEYGKKDLDSSWDLSSSTMIQLNGTSISVNGAGAKANGNVLSITSAGTYVLTGSLTEGSVSVNAGKEDLVRIVLNGASINNSTGPAILGEQSEKLVLILAENTKNTLTDGTSYKETSADNPPNGTLFSRDDVTINGTGTLTINGNYMKGISVRDDLIIVSGNVLINAKDDGINAHEAFRMKEGTLTITAGDDGIHADNSLTLDGGIVNVLKSYEGLEAAFINMNGGNVTVLATDDGVNVSGGNDQSGGNGKLGPDSFVSSGNYYAKINGGTMKVSAAGDGLDINGSVYFTGGDVTVFGPTEQNNAALDYDGVGEVTGGTQVFAGSSGMAMGPSENSTSNSIMIYFNSEIEAGTKITVKDASGKVIIFSTPEKSFQNIVLSTTGLKTGSTYTIFSGNKELTRVEISNVLTRISEDGSAVTSEMGGMGGGKGMGGKGFPGGGHQRPSGTQPPPSGTGTSN